MLFSTFLIDETARRLFLIAALAPHSRARGIASRRDCFSAHFSSDRAMQAGFTSSIVFLCTGEGSHCEQTDVDALHASASWATVQVRDLWNPDQEC